MHSGLSSHESQRLEALRSYDILDTGAEDAFDDLTALAAHACGAPMALLSLIDRDRQWIKAAVGTRVRETPRRLSVCTYTVEQASVLVIPDLAADRRFAANAFLRREVGARFYAGAPLLSPEGFALGTLCVLDVRPRELTEAQRGALERLARQAMAQMELRRSLRALTERGAELDAARGRGARTGSILQAALESTADGLLAVDREGGLVTYNRAFADLWGMPDEILARSDDASALGYAFAQVRDPEAFAARVAVIYAQPEAESHDLIELRDGRIIERYSRPQRLEGEVVGRVWSFRDITERARAEAALRERERQLAEAQQLAQLGYWDWDVRTDRVRWSAEMCRIYGEDRARDTLSLEEFLARVHPADRDAVRAGVLGALAERRSFRFEHRIIRPDGAVRTLQGQGELVSGPDGEPVRMFGTGQDVTERREAEDEVRRAQASYRALFDLSGDAIYVHDPETGAILDVNRAACEMHGYPREAFATLGIAQLTAGEEPYTFERAIANFRRAAAGEPMRVEWLARHSSGRLFWQEVTLQRVTLDGGDRVLATARDISERREAEEALRRAHAELEERVAVRTAELAEANRALVGEIEERVRAETELQRREERFRSLIENASDLITILSPEGMVHYESPSIRPILGYEQGELHGRSVFEYIHDDDRAGALERLRGVLERPGSSTSAEFRFRHRDGSWRVLEAVGSTLRPDSAADGVVINSRDITERKQAEESLRFHTTLLEAQNHTVIDGILVTHQGRVLSMNLRYAELFRVPEALRTPERGVEMLRWARSQAADPQAYRARIEELRADPEAVGRDEVLLADGRALDRYTAPLRSADGRYYGRLWVIRDISDRKRTEEELRLARDEAERANQAKSEFLSRMSHELRTPMNSILGFAQLLARRNLPPDQLKSVEHILKAGRHLLNLINEVLDIARIEANRQQFSLEPVRVRTALQEALALIRPLAAQHGCEVQEVQETAEHYVRADRQRLTQVLLNLLSNAVKYNLPGGRVWLTCHPLGETLRIGVHDTGRGIPADRLNELFVPFARLGAEQSGVEGTGLGLALSQRLVEAMDGSLEVESSPGVGSTFWIELPLTESPLARLEASRLPVRMPAPGAPARPAKTVLYIEDNLANWNLVETILAGRPEIQLLPALQGRLGLELAREHAPDLILLDLHLPDMPGERVLRELRADARTRALPVLVISADATRHQIERLRAAGAQSYLTKPIDVGEFLDAIDALLHPPLPPLA